MRRMTTVRNNPVAALEARQLLAGAVTASLAAGTLTITGDNLDNKIFVDSIGGQLHVQAKAGTKINGVTDGEVLFALPTQTVVWLGGGNDDFRALGDLGGGLTVNGGNGNDTVGLFQIRLAKNLLVDIGSGNDMVFPSWFSFNDTLIMPSVIAGSATIIGGSGVDAIYAHSLRLGGSLLVDLGNGNDVAQLWGGRIDQQTQISMGSGIDVMTSDGAEYNGSFTFQGGNGEDNVELMNNKFHGFFSIDLGNSEDGFKSTNDSFFGGGYVSGGNGFDHLISKFDQLSVTGFEY